MANLFIETNARKQQEEELKSQKAKIANQRVAKVNSGGYEWGLIQKFKKHSPKVEAILNPEESEDEFKTVLQGYGLGNDSLIHSNAKDVLGDRSGDSYFIRKLTQYTNYLLQKYAEKFK